MGEQKNIPELRFPEFDREWKTQMLEEISIRGSGHTPNKDHENYYNGGIKWVSLADSKRLDAGIIEETENRISQEGLKNSSAVLHPKGTVILSRDAGVGKSAVLGDDMAVSQHFIVWRPKKELLSNWFLYYSLQIFKREFERIAIGSTIKTIGLPYFKKFKLTIPSFPEQQKIASFFTAIDKKISQLKQKKTLLEQYKKGVMQKIFSQEIRFRDDKGQAFPKWENNKINQVYSFGSTNSFSRDNLNYIEGDVKNIHYGDIHKKFHTLFDLTKEDVPFINLDISLSEIKEYNYCKTSDLVFADASEDVEDVGKCIELVYLNDEKVLAGLHTILARPNTKIMADGFGGYLMKSYAVRKQIMKISQGSKVASISSSRLGEVDIIIPCPKEQSKIANFLSTIDNKISYTQTQIEKAELWKKGMLQKMFV